VSDVRILAVQADQPFAHPGDQVALDALAVDPRGRPLTYAWTTCTDAPSTIVTACLDAIAAAARAGRPPSIASGVGLSTYSLSVATDALSGLPADEARNASIGIVTVVCPGTISFGAPAAWTPGELPVQCTDASGVAVPPGGFVVSVKTVYLRRSDRNQNPPIADVTWNGTSWAEGEVKALAPCDADPTLYGDCHGGDRPEIAIVAGPGAVESGTNENGIPFTEQVIGQYYGTQTVFEADVRDVADLATHAAARKVASGTTQTLWFVLRDDRGGVSWATRTIRVE
jgi:hypothetical protein